MTPQEQARWLAMARELHRILGELFDLPENGPGSPVADAWDHMDVVIEALEGVPLFVRDMNGNALACLHEYQ